MPNGFSNHYQLDESISNLRIVGKLCFNSIQILKLHSVSRYPDQTPHIAASDLVLHCLLMSRKKDARLKWVNNTNCYMTGENPVS